MNWRLSELPNGLRVVSIERPHTLTVAMKVFVGAGSCHDPAAAGTPHLLEHLLFKGARERPAKEIYTAIESLGGSINGHTGKEYTRFDVIMLSEQIEVGVSHLAEILIRPLLAEQDFWQEKLVILEEIRQAKDRTRIIYDLFAQAIWPDHALRHPVMGEPRRLAALDYAQLLAFYRQFYLAGNEVVVMCGDIEHGQAVELVERHFSALAAGAAPPWPDAKRQPPDQPRIVHDEKSLLQTHLLLGFLTVGMSHPDRSALKVIERVLGMGGSSRLFQRLREEKKLVYSINTATAHYRDTGYLALYTTCQPQNAAQVVSLILEEFDRLRESGVSVAELARAKSNYAGVLARRFETNSAIASIFGIEALLHRIEPFADSVARIQAVRQADVIDAARRYLTPERYVLATLGRSQ